MFIPKNQLENMDRALVDVDWAVLMGCDDADIGSDIFLSKVQRNYPLFLQPRVQREKEVHLPPLAQFGLSKTNEA